MPQELVYIGLFTASSLQSRPQEVFWSLTPESTATLVHAFITASLNYCSSLYAGLPVGRLQCLARVQRTAARLSGRTPKFGHVSRYLLDVLHWLSLQQRISYRIISLVRPSLP